MFLHSITSIVFEIMAWLFFLITIEVENVQHNVPFLHVKGDNKTSLKLEFLAYFDLTPHQTKFP